MSEEPVDPATAKLNRKTFRYTVAFTAAYAFAALLAASPWFEGVRSSIASGFDMLAPFFNSVLEFFR